MAEDFHIAQAARALGVTPGYLRLLERQGTIPPARRDLNGRVYSDLEIVLLKAMGVGSHRRLKTADDVLAGMR